MTKERDTGLASLPPKPAVQQPPKGGQEAPKAPQASGSLDDFVKAPVAPSAVSLEASPIEAEEPTQRLTLEIPLSLHVEIKAGCARRRTKIKQEVMALLEAHYRPKPQ